MMLSFFKKGFWQAVTIGANYLIQSETYLIQGWALVIRRFNVLLVRFLFQGVVFWEIPKVLVFIRNLYLVAVPGRGGGGMLNSNFNLLSFMKLLISMDNCLSSLASDLLPVISISRPVLPENASRKKVIECLAHFNGFSSPLSL